MASKKRKTVSIEPEQAEYIEQSGLNFSEFVRRRLEEEIMSEQMSRRERLEEQLEELEDERADLQEQLEEVEDEMQNIRETIADIESEQEDQIETVIQTLQGERGAVTIKKRKRDTTNRRIQQLASQSGLSVDEYCNLLDAIDLHKYEQSDEELNITDAHPEGYDLTDDEEQAAREYLRDHFGVGS